MRTDFRKIVLIGCLLITAFLNPILFLPASEAAREVNQKSSKSEKADTQPAIKKNVLPLAPADDYNQGLPARRWRVSSMQTGMENFKKRRNTWTSETWHGV